MPPTEYSARRDHVPAPETRRLGYRIGKVLGMTYGRLVDNPIRNLRARRSLAKTYAAQARAFGTADQALSFALDDLDGTPDQIQFLNDWQHGALADWPQYQPPAPRPVTLSKRGFLIRAAAVFGGFFAALLLASVAFGPTQDAIAADPIQILLELAWSGSVLICALVAWRAAGRRTEG